MSEEGWSGVNDEEELVLTDFDRMVQIAYLDALEYRKIAKARAKEQIRREMGLDWKLKT